MNPRGRPSAALYGLAWAAWILTFGLILVGGAVTSTGSGMAVPDCPTTFGHGMFDYPWWQSATSVFIEHGHRMLGRIVGIALLALLAGVAVFDRRRGVRILAETVFLCVVAQGLLGEKRVVWDSRLLAMAHGILAQVCLAALSVLVLALSPAWRAGALAVRGPTAAPLSNLSLFLVVSALMQLFFGVVLRHTGTGLFMHLVGAGAIAYGAWQLRRATRTGDAAAWRRPSAQVFALVALQLGLGALSWLARPGAHLGWIPPSAGYQEWITTLHVGGAALLLARAATMLAWCWGHMEEAAGAPASRRPAYAGEGR